MFKRSVLTLAVLAVAGAANAVLGGYVIVQNTGNVMLTYLGSTAGFHNANALSAPTSTGTIFDNTTTAVNTTYNLGNFTSGTELIFALNVISTGNTFYTGPSSRNPDGVIHANVVASGDGVDVFFEDIYGGGDLNYNDLNFHVSNAIVGVPGPAAIAPFAMGALATLRRRRAKRA